MQNVITHNYPKNNSSSQQQPNKEVIKDVAQKKMTEAEYNDYFRSCR